MVNSPHVAAQRPPRAHKRATGRQSGRRPDRRPSGRQDDARPGTRQTVSDTDTPVRPRVLRGSRAPRRSAAGAVGSRRAGRSRRGATPSRPVPDTTRAGRPSPPSGPVPGPGERLARLAATEFRIPRRPRRLLRVARTVPGRDGAIASGRPLAAGWLPGLVHGPQRRRQLPVASGLRADVRRAGHRTTRHRHPRRHARAFLEHARPLPRAGLERLGAGPGVQRLPSHRAPLPRCPGSHVHGTQPQALEREPAQAPGPVAQGLRP